MAEYAALALDVGGVEQYATPPPGRGRFDRLPAGSFPASRDVGVDDQANVGFVDAHAEGVGGGDDAQFQR